MIYLFSIGFLEVKWVDVIDILLVGILLYQVYKLIRGSVALSIFFGFLSLYLLFLVVKAAQMELLTAILGQFMGVGVLAVIVLFQQEIRKFLLLIGKTTTFNKDHFLNNFWRSKHRENDRINITPIIDACKSLSGSNTGALIVFSKNSPLKFYAESGDEIDAVVSKRLILSIFNKYSPMHDGALIIHNNRVKAARCILPVTERDNLPAEFGLRHRAAVGMTELTDTLVVVVSEETGQISTVQNGYVAHNLPTKELRKKINHYLFEDEEETPQDQVKVEKDQARAEEEAYIQKKEKVKEKGKAKADKSVGAETD